MEIIQAISSKELKAFFAIPHAIYKSNPFHRATENSITELLVKGPTAFHSHARVIPCLFLDDNKAYVGRCAFIHDSNLSDTVQVAFFEAKPTLQNVVQSLKCFARKTFPEQKKLVIGLNGHLNYGAGILLDHFDQPPVFGLPYTAVYYPQYFSELKCRKSVSFRFPLAPFYAWKEKMKSQIFDTQGITVRCMNKKNLKKEIELYTHIDNASFSNAKVGYWSNRRAIENFELFNPFRFLADDENLIFAEKQGKPVGFLLWYPDFNELTGPGKDLGITHLLRYRFANPIKTARFTEVALLPEYRKSSAVQAMILKMIEPLQSAGYEMCEGGFIFEENVNSLVMTRRFLERSFGAPMQPYRSYGIFEGSL